MEHVHYREVDGLVKLAGAIAVWDVLRWHRGKQTFSVQVGNLLLRNDAARFAPVVVWAILTHHLFCNLLPKWARRTWRMPCRSERE